MKIIKIILMLASFIGGAIAWCYLLRWSFKDKSILRMLGYSFGVLLIVAILSVVNYFLLEWLEWW